MIPGTVIGLQGQIGFYGSFTANYGNVSGAISLFSFPNCDIGPPSPNRIIAITANYWKFDTSVTLRSVTVGGVSLTQRVIASREFSGGTGSLGYAAIWSGVVPNGSTATISLQFATNASRGCDIGIWALYDANSSTPFSTSSGTASGNNAITLSGNVQANDFGVVAASGFYGSGGSFSYTNATERYDLIRSPPTDYIVTRSGADFTALSAQSPRTITVTPSGLNAGSVACMAIWR